MSFAKDNLVPLTAFALALIFWRLFSEHEVFDRFHDFSHAHEQWNLEAIALLFLNITMALTVTSVHQLRKLRKLNAEREGLMTSAEKSARHDPLTGLMNRRAFSERLDQIEHDGRLRPERIIAMVDLDRFKPVNDLYGHAAGDATLCEIAARLTTEVGCAGAIARLGGDEFAVIFAEGVDVNQVERVSRRLLHAMESPIRFAGNAIYVGFSIGLVSWKSGTDHSEALRRADKALYMSKGEGRGRFTWYDAELDRPSHERAAIEADLRQAIARYEIEPWFQPIVQMGTGQLSGFEVLARWKHPTRGEIPPEVFIEIAEDSGQIGNLGFNLLHRACMAARDWGRELTIAFNISPHQFLDSNLVAQLEEILKECDFDPRRLTIEVTESSIIHDFDMARAKLNALKALGVKVALDDFGTGYSSLASLRKLPFDRIKIDRSFVTNIAAEPQNQKIVTGIMALANGLELDVTAEGIESEQDRAYIETLHCSMGQGFLFDKAIPPDQVSWLLETKWSQHRVDATELTSGTHAAKRERDAG
ncbi:hypothetical protein GCM10011324_14860 [Allosediminivita pacifica]|nr:hypothetical protein GCM10011324_14860 [Allosediminivita pacifica]